jgi:hypothetical protein
VVRGSGTDPTIPGGITWSLAATDVPAFTAGASWTIPGLLRARLWGGTASQVTMDVEHTAYVVFLQPNDPQLYFVAQENWAAVYAGTDVCRVAWVDAHWDLLPRMPRVAPQSPVTLLALCLVGTQVWCTYQDSSLTVYIRRVNLDQSSAGPDINTGQGVWTMSVVGTEVWFLTRLDTIVRFQFNGLSAGANYTVSPYAGGGIVSTQAPVNTNGTWILNGTSDMRYTIIDRYSASGGVLGSFGPFGLFYTGTFNDGAFLAEMFVVGTKVWAWWSDGNTGQRYFLLINTADGSYGGSLAISGVTDTLNMVEVVGSDVYIITTTVGVASLLVCDFSGSILRAAVSVPCYDSRWGNAIVTGTEIWGIDGADPTKIDRLHLDGTTAGPSFSPP